MNYQFTKFDELCHSRGVTVAEVSRATGIAQPTLSNWRRRNSVSADTVRKLAQYFDVSPDYFVQGMVEQDGYIFDGECARLAQYFTQNAVLRQICEETITLSTDTQTDLLRLIRRIRKEDE